MLSDNGIAWFGPQGAPPLKGPGGACGVLSDNGIVWFGVNMWGLTSRMHGASDKNRKRE